MGYLRKHWRGELPLVTAFWINVFLLNLAIRFLETGLTDYPPTDNPVTASRITIIYVFLAIAITYPWQIIGLWRTCNRHIAERGRHLVARLVQVLVVFGVLGTVGQVNTSWPVYKDFYQIGFQKDPLGDYTLRLIKDDSLVHLQGPMSFGVSEKFERLLQTHPDVEGIVLDSVGGRLYEGRELSKLITIHGLDTYSLKGCYSMCTLAFISGENRFLGTGANLAFHQYNLPYKSFGVYVDLKKEQEEDLRIFRRQGIKPEFLAKLFDMLHDDLWYPSVDELLSAGVIQGIISPSDLTPVKYEETAEDFQKIFETLLAIPAFKTVKQYEPETYHKIVEALKKQVERGATAIEIQNAVSSHILPLATRVLPKSSDDALINYVRDSVSTIKKLEEKDPILCLKFINPQQYGAAVWSKYLSRDELMSSLDALSRIIVDAYEKENPAVDTQAAERIILKSVLQLGGEAEMLDSPSLQGRDQYKRYCDAIVVFYQIILQEEKNVAGNTLRYVFGQN